MLCCREMLSGGHPAMTGDDPTYAFPAFDAFLFRVQVANLEGLGGCFMYTRYHDCFATLCLKMTD